MEIDMDVGQQGYNESQVGGMDVLVKACELGVTPDFPTLDHHQPANQVVASHEKDINQTTSFVYGDVCYLEKNTFAKYSLPCLPIYLYIFIVPVSSGGV
jgi:hypothetical protein